MPSSGEAWRSTRSAGCRCSRRPPGTSATSRSEAREGTRLTLPPRRQLTLTSPSPSPAGPLLEPGRAPPRCHSISSNGGKGRVRGQGESRKMTVKVLGDRKRYKTSPLFFFLCRLVSRRWLLFVKRRKLSDPR